MNVIFVSMFLTNRCMLVASFLKDMMIRSSSANLDKMPYWQVISAMRSSDDHLT